MGLMCENGRKISRHGLLNHCLASTVSQMDTCVQGHNCVKNVDTEPIYLSI